MADNVFDQFDAPEARPAIKAQAAPAGNVFDQFDAPSRPAPSFGEAASALYRSEMESKRLSRQGVSPHVFSDYAPAKVQKLGEVDEGNEIPNSYKDTSGTLRVANPKTDFIANDPETGKLTVFARHTAAAGSEAQTLTNEGKLARIGRELVPSFATGPVAGIQRTAEGVRALGTVGTRTGAELATQRATEAARDAQAFKDTQVRPFGPAFNQGPVASVAKQLSETPIIGAPVRNALEESMRDTVAAQGRILNAMAPSASVEQTGAAMQRGLDRYRTAGIRDVEPGVLENMGIEARAPVQARVGMTEGAADRARQADQIRQQAGETSQALTSRGVSVPSARPMSETITARRTAEDMSPQELARIIRAPSSEVSFAAKQEALFEHAWQQIPAKFKINNTRNPDMMRATNTDQVFRGLGEAERRAGISGGIVDGRFAGMAERLRTNVQLQDLKTMRTEIGRALSNFGVYDSRLDRTQLKQIYGAISRDIEVGVMDLANRARIQSRLGNNRADAVGVDAARRAEGALYALRRADRYTRMGMERMDRFSKVVGTDNPQAAAGMLIRAALDGTRGNMQMLRTATAVLRPEERSQLSRLVFQELGRPQASAGGIVQELGFSPESALTRWQSMNPAARTLLFGGEHAKAIDDFVRVVSRLANVEKMANRPRTATNAMNLSALLGSAGSIAAGNIAVPAGIAGTGLAASVLFSRPAYVKWATTYAHLRAAALRAPINVTAPRMITHINRLGELAKRDQALLPVYRAIAAENGIAESPDAQQEVKH